MKRNKHLLLICAIAFIAASCSSGYKSYKRGDYYKACIESIERLRSNPHHDKSQFTLTKSYPLAQKAAMRQIENATIANEPDKYDIIVYQYERLNELANFIYSSPKANSLIPTPTEYIAELADAKEKAAQRAYEFGLRAFDQDNIDQARVAYQYFQKANKYVYGYKDVLRMIDEARYEATLRVVVQRPITSNRFQYSADFFYNNLVAEMSQNAKNRFVRFYTQEDAYQEGLKNAHQYIVLNFEDFSVGNITENNNTIDVKRDSVIVGSVKVEGKTYNTYNTVYAKFTTHRREIKSGGILSLRIIDAQTNQSLQQRNFAGEYFWNTNWYSYRGDERALSPEQKKLCETRAKIPPSHQDLFIEFTKPIYTQAASFVRSAYTRY